MKRMKFLLSVASLLVSLTPLYAAAESDGSDNTSEGIGIAPYPIIAYTPETKVMIGGGSILYWNGSDHPDRNDKKNSINIRAFGTQLRQYDVCDENTIYSFDNTLMIISEFEAEKTPSTFYGIGPRTSEKEKQDYTYTCDSGALSVLYRIHPVLYAGPSFSGKYYKMITRKGTLGSDRNQYLSGNAITTAPGLSIVLDTTGGGLYKTNGVTCHIDMKKYDNAIGSKYDFYSVESDMQAYNPLWKGTLCAQIKMKSVNGHVPFYYYPSLGGDTIGLRGILLDRRKDKRCVFAQLEYRFPLFWRIGGAAFGGAGDVEPRLKNMGKNIYAAGGCGIRFAIDPEEKINFRIDWANDGTQNCCYFKILESF